MAPTPAAIGCRHVGVESLNSASHPCRAFAVSKGATGGENAVVVPFLDMLNHKPHPVCYHTFSADRGRYELRTLGHGIPCGEEATISYGTTGNGRLAGPPLGTSTP